MIKYAADKKVPKTFLDPCCWASRRVHLVMLSNNFAYFFLFPFSRSCFWWINIIIAWTKITLDHRTREKIQQFGVGSHWLEYESYSIRLRGPWTTITASNKLHFNWYMIIGISLYCISALIHLNILWRAHSAIDWNYIFRFDFMDDFLQCFCHVALWSHSALAIVIILWTLLLLFRHFCHLSKVWKMIVTV